MRALIKKSIFLVTIIFFCQFVSFSHAFMNEGTLRVGQITIASGGAAGYGTQIRNGSLIAVEEINQSGGIRIGGKMVKIEMEPYIYDTGLKLDQTVALVRKLAESDKVLFIHGPSFSSEAEVAFGSLQKKLDDPSDTGTQILAISASAGVKGLAAISPWAFVNVFQEEKQIRKQIPILMEHYKPIKTVGVFINNDDTYSYQTWKKTLEPILKELDLEVKEYTEGLVPDRDFSAQISKLKMAKPDMWIISAHYNINARVMIEAKRQGFVPKVVMSNVASLTPDMIKIGREAVEGLIVGGYLVPDSAKLKPVEEKFKARTKLDINQIAVNAYEIIYMAKWVIEKSDIKNLPESLKEDRRKFRDGFSKIRGFEGMFSRIDIDPDTGDAIKDGIILQVKNGKFVPWQAK